MLFVDTLNSICRHLNFVMLLILRFYPCVFLGGIVTLIIMLGIDKTQFCTLISAIFVYNVLIDHVYLHIALAH